VFGGWGYGGRWVQGGDGSKGAASWRKICFIRQTGHNNWYTSTLVIPKSEKTFFMNVWGNVLILLPRPSCLPLHAEERCFCFEPPTLYNSTFVQQPFPQIHFPYNTPFTAHLFYKSVFLQPPFTQLLTTPSLQLPKYSIPYLYNSHIYKTPF
jgi:hypothetical protein